MRTLFSRLILGSLGCLAAALAASAQADDREPKNPQDAHNNDLGRYTLAITPAEGGFGEGLAASWNSVAPRDGLNGFRQDFRQNAERTPIDDVAAMIAYDHQFFGGRLASMAGIGAAAANEDDPIGSERSPAWTIDGKLQFDIDENLSLAGGARYADADAYLRGPTTGDETLGTGAVEARVGLVWKPADNLRMGWRVMWSEVIDNGRARDDMGGQFGAWFSF